MGAKNSFQTCLFSDKITGTAARSFASAAVQNPAQPMAKASEIRQ